jgi:8-oxo-dGTP pyrophosphatase MutT (NUDIX family)
MGAQKRPRVVLVNRCFVKNATGRLLVIRRSPDDQNNAGKWEVPGGKLDEGQDLVHAQEREVLEETGLLVRPTRPLVFVDSFVLGTGKYKGLPYVVLFSITEVIGGKAKISEGAY